MNIATTTCTADTIVAEVVIAAPQSRVWAALTDGAALATWWGSPDTYQVTDCSMDVRVGGRWISHGVGADGTKFSVSGEFLAIEPMDRLVMTWEPSYEKTPPTTIVYSLKSERNDTRLRLTHSGFAGHEASRDAHAMGWVRVLGWLTSFVEREAAAAAN